VPALSSPDSARALCSRRAFLGEAADEILGDEMVCGDVVPLEKIKVPVGPFDEPGPAFSGGGTPADPDDGNHGPFGRFGC
jgi:hypothetical protein